MFVCGKDLNGGCLSAWQDWISRHIFTLPPSIQRDQDTALHRHRHIFTLPPSIQPPGEKSMKIMTNMEFLVSRKFCTSDVGDWSISPAGTPGMKGTCEATKILFNFHFFFFPHFYFLLCAHLLCLFFSLSLLFLHSHQNYFHILYWYWNNLNIVQHGFMRPESDQTFPCNWLANMGFGDLISVTLVVEDAQNLLMFLKISKCFSTSDCWATN